MDSPLYQNARLNDEEFRQKAHTLQYMPRWMRFAYSWVCNLSCYHCFQKETRRRKECLPQRFMTEILQLGRFYQVLHLFGGEPFLYPPALAMLENPPNPHCRFFMATNGTLLQEKHFEQLERVKLGMIAVSLDAATPESYDLLRRKGYWPRVMETLRRLSLLKKKKDFLLVLTITMNSLNFDEIERFVELGLSFDAEPLFNLVCNSKESLSFQKKYLHFSPSQFAIMTEQIERSLPKVKARGFRDSALSLEHLKGTLEYHRRNENCLPLYSIRKKLKRIFRTLPSGFQEWLRKKYAATFKARSPGVDSPPAV
jgi:sulfatase maturation enzyme AslB (radical SAM superfamily)